MPIGPTCAPDEEVLVTVTFKYWPAMALGSNENAVGMAAAAVIEVVDFLVVLLVE